ncbi:MAG: CHAD domain-containing protein, partial [Gammaproteobacteria bacterium]|nr:CHAD domain-containing protein [Gammaproteobacteria bacterium]
MAPRSRHSTPAPARARTNARSHARTEAGAPSAAQAKGAGNAGAEAREVEWQLTAPDLAVVRRWLEQHARLDSLSIEPLPAQQLHDTYLDTGDWRILRAGFALRLREKGGHPEATLKGLRSARDDVADRREITEPLSGRGAKALARAAGPVGSRVRDVAGIKPLRTLFEVRTSRQRFAVRRRDCGADVGEIALDEARFSRGDGHRRPMVLTRVELEAVGPDSAPLERLEEQLRCECALHRATENKFAVGLRSASLEPPRDARPGREAEQPPAVMDAATRAGDFAAATLQQLLREWQANEPAARLGEGPEALHKLRVAGRRMDTVLNLFRSCLPAGLAKSRPTLKALVGALGGVRDADIRLQAVSVFRTGLPDGDRPALDPLVRYLESERDRARVAMLRALDAKPARHWLDTLPDQLARAAAATASASSRNAAALTVVPDLIRKRYRQLCKCAGRLTPDSSMREFHKARIRAKKLRYAVEVVAPTYAKPADRMIATLQKLQSRLGTQHDADVLARYLAQLAAHPPVDLTAATFFMMGRMAQLNAAEAARLGRRIEKAWRKLRGRRWSALRSRMQALRDDTRRRNKKISPARHGAGE